MALDVTTATLGVDEDQGAWVNDPDERAWNGNAGFTTYEAALRTAALSIAGAAATAEFGTPQLALESDMFTLSGAVTNLKLSSTAGGLAYPTSGSGIDSGLTTSDGQHIYLFQGPTEDIVKGVIGDAAGNPAAFVIVLDEDKSGAGGAVVDANLWIIQYAAITHTNTAAVEGDTQSLMDLVYVTAASTSSTSTEHVFSDFSDVPAGAPIFAMIADDQNSGGGAVDYLVTAFSADNPATANDESDAAITVNVSNQGSFPGSLAAGSQNITPGTGLRFDLVTNGDNVYSQKEGKIDTNIDFATHADVTQAGFTIVQNQGGRETDILIKAMDVTQPTADGHAFFTALQAANAETSVAITDVRIYVINPDGAEGALLYDNTPSGGDTITASNIAVTFNGDGTVKVENVLLNYSVEIGSAAGFQRFTVTNVSPESNTYIDIGRLTYTTIETTNTSTTTTHEIGSLILADDSGPTISVIAATAGALPADDDALGSSVASFGALFTNTHGADGLRAVNGLVYSLGSVAGPCGLVDAQSNQAILLRTNADGSVEGYVTLSGADTTVFRLVTNASNGDVTLTQLRAIEHILAGVATNDPLTLTSANLVTLTGTITDKDGDQQAATVNIGQTLSFADAQPTITTQPLDMSLGFTEGSADTKAFAVDFHNDIQGTVTFNQASLVYSGPYTPVFVSGTLLEFQDGGGQSVYHVDLTNGGYTVTVDQSAAPGEPQALLFSSISAGGPREILTVGLADGSDSIVFNGLLTNSSGQLYDPGAATDADNLNPDSLGFGLKGGQASQINPGEGFEFSTLSPSRELQSFDFDVQGIGNIKTVTVNYSLYEDNGTADKLDDTLIEAGSKVLNLGAGNSTIEVVLSDTSGDTFDYGVVQFIFPANKGVVDPNQGVRVLDFHAAEEGPRTPDTFSIGLNVADTDMDVVSSTVFTVDLFV